MGLGPPKETRIGAGDRCSRTIKRIDTAHYEPMIERSLAEYGGFNAAMKKGSENSKVFRRHESQKGSRLMT